MVYFKAYFEPKHSQKILQCICSVMQGEKRFSDASRFSLQWFWACFFPACVRVRDAVGYIAQYLRCETRAHCLTVCFYFRYVFISTVWNAVLLDARTSRTDRLSRALCVCLSWSSIAAAVKCTCILHLHLADAFIQTYIAFKLQYLHFISSCFPWESNPWSWRC